ncbi:MAG: hypothetical protein IPK53_12475 [bacterium]|nr:hypothetical protein [bacterium]
MRFVADSQRGKYDSLKAAGRSGRPGVGACWAGRAAANHAAAPFQLETAWEVTGNDPPDSGQRPVPFFVPLNAYRGARLADPPPDPAEWLAERWQKQQPGLPDFAALLRADACCCCWMV